MEFAPVTTKRLELRCITDRDSGMLRALISSPGISFGPIAASFPPQQLPVSEWIKTCDLKMAAGNSFLFGCWLCAEPLLIGLICLEAEGSGGELKCFFADAYRGQGYEVEALCRIRDLAFDSLYLARVFVVAEDSAWSDSEILEHVGLHDDSRGPRSVSAVESVKTRTFHLERANMVRDEALPWLPLVFVGAVALIDQYNRVLLGKRRANAAMGGLWEFPGGKLEPGESLMGSAIREINEELGVTVVPSALTPFRMVSHLYSDFHIFISLFLCRDWLGSCNAIHHQAIKWVSAGELSRVPVPQADIALLRELSSLLILTKRTPNTVINGPTRI